MVRTIITLLFLLFGADLFSQTATVGTLNISTTLASGTVPSALTITSPTHYQTFQRSGAAGTIAIAGMVTGTAASIQARINLSGVAGTWVTVATDVSGSFTATLASAEGQGTFEIRIPNSPVPAVSYAHVGIGDVFLIAGQSNAEGQGTFNQSFSHASLIATLFANSYTWSQLLDPIDNNIGQIDSVSSDSTAMGSVWPLVATSFLSNQSVPIAFVPCAFGGSSIVAWQPGASHTNRATLYGSMIYRGLQTGAKAVLWWQGETDALASMSQGTYSTYLATIANAVKADLGVNLMPCKLQNSSGISDANEALINAAIGSLWGVNVNVLTGPDLSSLATDDAYHLKTSAKLDSAATLWWLAIKSAFSW